LIYRGCGDPYAACRAAPECRREEAVWGQISLQTTDGAVDLIGVTTT
jgi:hypothetical protein